MMTFVERIEKSKAFWFLLIISFFFFLLRLPSLFEPYWYGDEGIYQVIGTVLRSGGEAYVDAWDNKPPLLFLVYALFNGDQFYIRGLSLLFGVLTIISYFTISRKIVGKKISFLTTFLFVLYFGTPVIEGNIANTENFMILPITVSALLFVNYIKSENRRSLYLSGLVLGVTLLFKIVAFFDFLSLFTFLIFMISLSDIDRKSLLPKLKRTIKFGLIFIVPIAITSAYFLFSGNFDNYSRAVLLDNYSYVNHQNQFFIPQGFLILKLIILAGSLAVLYVYRKSIKEKYLFVLIWFFFSLFNVFFSQRPYEHYLILLLPSFFLLLGIAIKEKAAGLRYTVILLCGLVLVLSFFKLYQRNTSYYLNFVHFLSGQKDVSAYRSFFDKNTVRDYELALYIKGNTKDSDNVFVWSDNPQIYKLAGKNPPGKYSAAYHITFYKDGIENTQKAIAEKEPKLIVVVPTSGVFPFSITNYRQKINIMGADVYERAD